jgi:hypothetical protein
MDKRIVEKISENIIESIVNFDCVSNYRSIKYEECVFASSKFHYETAVYVILFPNNYRNDIEYIKTFLMCLNRNKISKLPHFIWKLVMSFYLRIDVVFEGNAEPLLLSISSDSLRDNSNYYDEYLGKCFRNMMLSKLLRKNNFRQFIMFSENIIPFVGFLIGDNVVEIFLFEIKPFAKITNENGVKIIFFTFNDLLYETEQSQSKIMSELVF